MPRTGDKFPHSNKAVVGKRIRHSLTTTTWYGFPLTLKVYVASIDLCVRFILSLIIHVILFIPSYMIIIFYCQTLKMPITTTKGQ